jgi:uncharacterized protein involved in outer membrane biogenesis
MANKLTQDLNFLPQSIRKDLITGELRSKIDLSSSGSKAREWKNNLNISGFLSMKNGTIDATLVEAVGLDLAEMGLSYFYDNPNTPIECFVGQIDFSQGKSERLFSNLVTKDTQIMVRGEADIAAEKVEIRIVPIPNDISPLSFDTPITAEGYFTDFEVELADDELKESLLKTPIQPAMALVKWIGSDDAEKPQGYKRCISMVKKEAS